MTEREEKSNSFTVLSSDPEAINLASGAKVHESTRLLWPLSENKNLRSKVENTFMVWSFDPVSKYWPFEDREMERTASI